MGLCGRLLTLTGKVKRWSREVLIEEEAKEKAFFVSLSCKHSSPHMLVPRKNKLRLANSHDTENGGMQICSFSRHERFARTVRQIDGSDTATIKINLVRCGYGICLCCEPTGVFGS